MFCWIFAGDSITSTVKHPRMMHSSMKQQSQGTYGAKSSTSTKDSITASFAPPSNSCRSQLFQSEGHIDSCAIDVFVNPEIAKVLLCVICQGVPRSGKVLWQTPCEHIFCFSCIKSWCDLASTCPTCKQVIDFEETFAVKGNFNISMIT